jgi:hypothetical protein
MAGSAIHLGIADMGDMGKINALWLPGIDQPRHFAFFLNVLLDEVEFVGRIPLNLLVAVHTLGQGRRAGKTAVLPKEMAARATVIDEFEMLHMIEIDRLFLLRIQQLGKNDPSHDKAQGKPDHEKQDDGSTGIRRGVSAPAVTIRWCCFDGVVCFAHGYSVGLGYRMKKSLHLPASAVPKA